jgi:hypothetical protein
MSGLVRNLVHIVLDYPAADLCMAVVVHPGFDLDLEVARARLNCLHLKKAESECELPIA